MIAHRDRVALDVAPDEIRQQRAPAARQLERQTGWVAQATVAPLSDVDAAIARWSRGRPAGGPARPAGRQVNGGQGLGLPHLALEEVHLDLALVRALPRDLARTYQLVPLWQAGRVLVAAVARWPLPEAARALLDRTGLFLRPVLADGPAIGAALDRTEAPHAYPLPEGYLELEERLARDRAVPRARLVAARERLLVRGEPTDVALAATDALAGADLAAALADSAGLSLASLDLASHDEPGIDPLGREVVRARVVDPVDPAAAGLIDEAQAWTWCALPFRRERGAVRVAVADPLSPALPALQAAIGQPVLGSVAPRDELEDAIHRTLGRPGVGQRVVAAGLATPAQLKQALELGRRTGVRVGTALVGLDYVSEDQLYAVLGEDAGLPFFSLDPALVAPEALTLLPEEVARQLLVLPIACDEASVTVATVEPLDASTLAALGEQTLRAVHQVLATERQLRQCLDTFYGQRFLERAASELLARSPEDSAYRVLSDGQKLILVGLLFGSAALLAANALAFLQAGVAFATLFIATLSAYKFYLIYRALSHSLEIPISREQVAALDERELPIYTILVPMYHEATVLPSLVRGLERLDYPRTKLDVKLLLEEDDLETREAAERLKLPPYCQVVVVPHGLPKGKPKACNYGLVHVKGEYVVIYDAEDLPDPDQLKKAILAFQTDESLACIQSKLNYFNRDQNILTRWFTAEYSVWFDLLLPGLDATNAPIPLGGTSNHFKTAQLRELGGWDPYNVTEDADLGLRLFARGWKTGVIDSTTYEEANSALYNWVRQRSRWVKGYIQTWLVRMRHPVALWRAIGPYGFFSFQMIVGGTFFSFLINPVFWLLTVLWFLTRWGVIQQLFPGAIFLLGALGLYAGNFVFTYLNVAGCLRRGYYGLVKYALLTPIYWALMSIAAWKGFLQLFYKPFYWEKTQHGLSAPPVLEPSSRGVEP